MAYTDEEIEEIAWRGYLQSDGWSTQENVRDAAKAALDAVLPDHDRELLEWAADLLDKYGNDLAAQDAIDRLAHAGIAEAAKRLREDVTRNPRITGAAALADHVEH